MKMMNRIGRRMWKKTRKERERRRVENTKMKRRTTR